MTDYAPSSGCLSDADPHSLHPDEALSRMLEACKPIDAKETIALENACGRVLAETVQANMDVPPQANSAMDGYAVCGDELPEQGRAPFQLLGSALAGHPYSGAWRQFGCVRIMTGAPVPTGADTVVPQELAEPDGEQVYLGVGEKGANVRLAGEDARRGEVLCQTGKRLGAGDIGYLATGGTSCCMLYRPLRVAFLSTGDELQQVGEKLTPGMGHIYDSNRHSLRALLARPGFTAIDSGLVADSPEALRNAFLDAANTADAIITSGGVSVGDADYVRQVLMDIGQINFWKVAIKPGRPLAFGRINNSWLFGLPGNPVSVHVTWDQLVAPVLRHLSGEQVPAPTRFKVRCTSRLKKSPGRVEYQRGILQNLHGETVVSKTGEQGSGILGSMSQGNCYIILPYECDGIQEGDVVTVQTFNDCF